MQIQRERPPSRRGVPSEIPRLVPLLRPADRTRRRHRRRQRLLLPPRLWTPTPRTLTPNEVLTGHPKRRAAQGAQPSHDNGDVPPTRRESPNSLRPAGGRGGAPRQANPRRGPGLPSSWNRRQPPVHTESPSPPPLALQWAKRRPVPNRGGSENCHATGSTPASPKSSPIPQAELPPPPPWGVARHMDRSEMSKGLEVSAGGVLGPLGLWFRLGCST